MENVIESVKIKVNGIMNDAVFFTIKNQLNNQKMWENSVNVFSSREDSVDGRWRGEYFGKQMRGAVLIYQYTQDEKLYEILTKAVLDLLSKQDEFGRFSTYELKNEFTGWDMWCRKYLLVGFIYYLKICKDDGLKEKIVSACKRHLDYILKKIGPNKNQIAITKTSNWWGCVNSCTILEPTVEMYKLTGENRYLDFAKYIILTGGCNDCNLIELALKGDKFPYEYPVTKAYEMMSFYEGLLAYYEVSGEIKYFDAVVQFLDAVEKTDITIIGCSGCTHELFDNSAKMQTEYKENIMQETCVTVTWMRLNQRVFKLTGSAKYIDRLEKSGFNALYGSLNTQMNNQLCMETGKYVQASAFDSYSPLFMNTRGRGIGGFNRFAYGDYNGCCIAIGACGIALMPLTAVMQSKDVVYINILCDGFVVVKDKTGKDVKLTIKSDYPAKGKAVITIEDDCSLSLNIRKPNYCEQMVVEGSKEKDEYFTLDKNFFKGEQIKIDVQMCIKSLCLNRKIAFLYGPLVLGSDEMKCEGDLQMAINANGAKFVQLSKEKDEIVRFKAIFKDGRQLIICDYQSCGKKWLSDKPLMTAWFNCKQ